MPNSWGTIIVAAGSGTRFGADIPKQYAPLCGRPVLDWTLEAFDNAGPVVLVVDPDHAPHFMPIVKERPHIKVVPGGITRQQSVKAGLAALNDNAPDYVLIHDAARPLVDAQAISRLKTAIEGGAGSATLAMPVVDTLMRGSDVIDRAGVQAIQTPQAFEYALIAQAHADVSDNFTDDASLVHAAQGMEATFVTGNADNFKITTPDDLARAEKLLIAAYADTRTGIGFDIHRAQAGDKVRLFGCDLPSSHSLIGHSDADAGLHAIADAILGAIGEGDIGLLFPPSDMQWKGMDSAQIVEKAMAMLQAKGGMLVHCDVMLMSEFPKIAPHRAKILGRLCEILKLPAASIGLKATTMEKLGPIGACEGLSVQALVTVRMKR